MLCETPNTQILSTKKGITALQQEEQYPQWSTPLLYIYVGAQQEQIKVTALHSQKY